MAIFFQLAVVVLSVLTSTRASQLAPDDNDPFVAYGNGTMFDISKVFDFP